MHYWVKSGMSKILYTLKKFEVTSEMFCFLYVFLKQVYNLAETRVRDFLFLAAPHAYHQTFSSNFPKKGGKKKKGGGAT